jgi:hypothetical protein
MFNTDTGEPAVKKALVLTVAAAIAFAGGCGSGVTSAPTPPPTKAPDNPAPSGTGPAYKLPTPHILDGIVLTTAGTGDATTSQFTVGTSWRFSYAYASCKGAFFGVQSRPSSAKSNGGQAITLAHTTLFARVGSVSQHAPGTYTLKISSTCKWAVTITNGKSQSGKPSPAPTPTRKAPTKAPAKPTPTPKQSLPPRAPAN